MSSETGGWLVLTRRVGDTLRIGDDIEIKVDEIRGRGIVKLALRAPRNVSILRDDAKKQFAAAVEGQLRKE